MRTKPSLLAVALASILATPAPAQVQLNESVALPAICTANAPHDMGSMSEGSQMPMGAAHADMMMGMDQMNSQMMRGMTATDIDVAFVCGMIPHHQGAINMAKAELAHGDDPWAKELALKVITAQEQEIADMLEWLSQQSN